MLLGAIVERLSGLPFHLYLQQQLLPGFGITLPDEAPVVAHVLDAHHWPSLAVSMVRAQDITPLTGLALSPQGITSLLSVLVSAPVEGDDTGPPTPLSETDDEAPLCDQPPPAEKAAAAAVLPPPAPSRNGNKAKEPPAPPLTRFPKEAVEMLTCKGNAPYAFSYSRQDPAGYVYLCLLDDHSYVLGPDAKGVSGPHGASSSGSGSTPPSSGRRRHANHGAIAATDGSKASNTLLLLMPYSGCALCIATNTNSPTALEMLAGAGAERFWGGSVWQGLAAAAVVSEPSAFAHHIALQIASRWPPLQMLSSEAALWLSPILRPPDPAAFIFCFPSIGSSASDACYNWPICGERLSLADVTAFELPGHGARAREPPCGTLETVVLRAAGLIAATTSHISHISLYGHGLGGLMAFETARCLHALYGRHVCHIFVSGCASPTCWGAEFGPGGPPGSRLSGAASAAGGGGGSVSSSLEMVPDDEELVAQLAAWPRTPPQMQDNKLLLRGALKALRAELSYEQAYVYSPPASSATPPAAKPKPPHPGGGKHHHSQQQQQQQQQSSEPAQPSGLKAAACLLPCGITVSFGTDDPTLTAAQLDQWRAVTSGPLTLRPFTGGHFFMRQGNNMVGMLDSMSRALITQLGPTGSCRRQQHAQSHHDPN